MVFPESFLELEHESGCVLSFVTLDALQLINSTEEPLKVAAAKDWVKTRSFLSNSLSLRASGEGVGFALRYRLKTLVVQTFSLPKTQPSRLLIAMSQSLTLV